MIEELQPGQLERGEKLAAAPAADLRPALVLPITFPLSVGGPTSGFGVAPTPTSGNALERSYLALAANRLRPGRQHRPLAGHPP
jgi:hypothetical protein